jgi:uncharacterized Ntn-hydrolase superfamily protein
VTFSIVARCERTGQLGVAAMTYALGVGKLVAHARIGAGAVATQAMVNPYLALDGLALLGGGMPAPRALDAVLASDPGREARQVGIVDARGRAAAFTGDDPQEWKGHRVGDGWACQGNRLVGPEVVDAAVEAFLAHPDDELALRLLAAVDAGEDQGGDAEGHRSATLTVIDHDAYPRWDLRVDHDDDALGRLRQEFDLLGDELIPQIDRLPSRDEDYHGFRPDDAV